MLAKAVAKESGARVLEIKGSEVYDMYVGEGEKNVKVISLLYELADSLGYLFSRP
jgi:SpoVK/Ycf46/Vps4 family AAA+-type ATPase